MSLSIDAEYLGKYYSYHRFLHTYLICMYIVVYCKLHHRSIEVRGNPLKKLKQLFSLEIILFQYIFNIYQQFIFSVHLVLNLYTKIRVSLRVCFVCECECSAATYCEREAEIQRESLVTRQSIYSSRNRKFLHSLSHIRSLTRFRTRHHSCPFVGGWT